MTTTLSITHWRSKLVHKVIEFSATPYLAHFYPYFCIPIPFEEILSQDEYKCFKKLCHYCGTCLQLRIGQLTAVKGYEPLTLFCHCNKPHSLQCRAAAQWIIQIVKNYLEAFSWSASLKDYHMLCNYYGSLYCHVICSAFYDGIHYIYVKIYPNAFYSVRHVLAGICKFYMDFDDSFAIIICRNCSSFCECCLRKCAKKIGRILERGNRRITITTFERKQFLNKYSNRYNAILNMYFDNTYAFTGLFR